MKIEYLIGLFESGQYRQCLVHLDDFIEQSENQVDALLLKAKCLFELSKLSQTNFDKAYNGFNKVLEIDRTNLEALKYSIYITVFITKCNISQSIELCNHWLQLGSPNQQIEALACRAKAHQISQNFNLAVNDYERIISLVKLVYANDRAKMDTELAVLYTQKANIHLNDLIEPQVALGVFKRGFEYRFADASVCSDMIKLAFDCNDYDFGGLVALHLFSSNETVSVKEVCELCQYIDSLVNKQISNKNILHAKLVAAKTFRDVVEVNPLDNLTFIRRCIALYPDWYVPYHYYGLELFNAEGYEEALPYIQRSLELGGTAMDVYMYLEANYRFKKEMCQLDQWPADDAKAYYNAGATFYNTELNLRSKENAGWFLENRAKFYERSFKGFESYFFGQVGSSLNNDTKVFAMCCNNYGIALASLKNYEEADRVHQIGYSLFPFWEQLSSWSEVLLNLGRYDEALCKVRQALKQGKEKIVFGNYLQLRCREAMTLYHLNNLDESRSILHIIEKEYDQFIASNKLSEEAKVILAERYVELQNVRFYLLKNESAEYAIQVWQKQLEKNPDDNSSWFMLMQKYYEIDDSRQCIACANNYLSLRGGAVSAEIALHVYYRRGMALINVNDYERALSDLNFVFELHCKKITLADLEFLILCKSLAICHGELINWKSSLGYSQIAIDILSVNSNISSHLVTEILLLYADANYNLGNRRAANKVLTKILITDPDNLEALKRKLLWKKTGLLSFLRKN